LPAACARLAALEAEQAALYAGPADKVAAAHARHAAIDDELLVLMERWEALEAR
jgi:ATP-binding cassette subfamily F protein uup